MSGMFGLPLTYYAYSGLFNWVVCSCIIPLVWKKRSDLSSARLFCYLSTLIAVWSFLYFLWLNTSDPKLAEFLLRSEMVFVAWIPSTFVHFMHALSGRFVPKYVLIGGYFLSAIVMSTVYTTAFCPTGGPFLEFPYWLNAGLFLTIHMIHTLVSAFGGLWLLGSTARVSHGRTRSQLWWAFAGSLIGFISGLTNYFGWYRIPIAPILNPFVSVYVLTVAYAIVRYELMSIKVVLRRSLVYSMLIACITAGYLVIVVITEKVFQDVLGYQSLFATACFAFLIAMFFNPLRQRIQTFVDRALFKGTADELANQRERLLVEIRRGEQMKAVGTLAAGLAHEIKNPLASIKTFTEHLDKRYSEPEFRRKFQKIVGGEVERINLIVQQLLDFAKPVPPRLELVELPRLLDDTLQFLNNEFIQRHVEVKKQYDWSGRILGDSDQLKQVFLNLFLNSLQAMDGNGRLEVGTSTEGNELLIAVSDSGRGIDPKDIERIFEPFFTEKMNGTGLGLAVVRSIVNEHRGRVEAENLPGRGARFKIYLPLTAKL